jgi:hypothetical protein
MNARESADQGDDPVRRAFVVRGRVQGVGFRWSTAQRARELGLEGAVWNRRDGAYDVIVVGGGHAGRRGGCRGRGARACARCW